MKRDRATMDLFSWEPPQVTKSFPAEQVRAASLRTVICRAVAAALKDRDADREAIAAAIASYLGEPCPKSMLDAYASEARPDHAIPLVRFIGLIHATDDMRLLQVLADLFDCAVIPKRYLPAIEEAVLADKIEELTVRRSLARKSWKGA